MWPFVHVHTYLIRISAFAPSASINKVATKAIRCGVFHIMHAGAFDLADFKARIIETCYRGCELRKEMRKIVLGFLRDFR